MRLAAQRDFIALGQLGQRGQALDGGGEFLAAAGFSARTDIDDRNSEFRRGLEGLLEALGILRGNFGR